MIALVVILAAALGAAVTAIVILLFLRPRSGWQITEAERRAELFRELQQLTGPTYGTPRAGGEPPGTPAVNGAGAEPAPPLPGQIGGKKHLRLLQGGIAAALVLALEFLRETWRIHRGRVVGTLLGAAATATTVTLLTITPWEDGVDPQPPSSAPSAAPTVTDPSPQPSTPSTRGEAPAAESSKTRPVPSSLTVPSRSAAPSPAPTGSTVPIGEQPAATGPEPSPAPAEDGAGAPTGGTDEDGDDQGDAQGSPPSAPLPTPGLPTPAPSATPVGSGLCAGLTVAPVLDVGVCLPGIG